jgi:L-asparaginase
MAYTASALSFLLHNLGKPVVLTGSQLPFGSVYSDARRNLVVSIYCAATLEVPEVCIFFNRELLRGNRAVKVNSWALNAFASPNFPPLATLGTTISVAADLLRPPPRGRFRVHREFNRNIVVLRLIPGFSDTVLDALFAPGAGTQGVILQTYGTGNASSRRAELLEALGRVVSRGIVVVVTTQCLSGTVDLAQYETGRRLQEIGCVSAGDMTTEAAATKLGFLLSLGLPRDELCRQMITDLRGELSIAGQRPFHGGRLRAEL